MLRAVQQCDHSEIKTLSKWLNSHNFGLLQFRKVIGAIDRFTDGDVLRDSLVARHVNGSTSSGQRLQSTMSSFLGIGFHIAE